MIKLITKGLRRFLVGGKQRFVFEKKERIDFPLLKKVDLYIHIPFCKSLCPYCPYNRIAYNKNLATSYTKAMLNEVEQYYLKFGKIEISSVYIGGGTPTNLIDELESVLKKIREKFIISGNICIETNPNDLNKEVIEKLKKIGVDLISIGIQSFNDKYLKILGRNYNSSKARNAIKLALSANFKSVNIDLMFVLPDQNEKDVLRDLKEAIEMGVDQITTYPLFTFPYSTVGKYLTIKKIKMPNFIKRRRVYKKIHNFCIQNGYQRVSVWGFKNSETPRYSSVTRDSYIGIGAGAASKISNIFYFNTFSIKHYIDCILGKKLPIAISMQLTSQLNKYYWLYWRLYDTYIDKNMLYTVFGENNLKLKIIFKILKFFGLYNEKDNIIELTERGSFYIHLLQNYFILNYINKVWSVAMKKPWPDRIDI